MNNNRCRATCDLPEHAVWRVGQESDLVPVVWSVCGDRSRIRPLQRGSRHSDTNHFHQDGLFFRGVPVDSGSGFSLTDSFLSTREPIQPTQVADKIDGTSFRLQFFRPMRAKRGSFDPHRPQTKATSYQGTLPYPEKKSCFPKFPGTDNTTRFLRAAAIVRRRVRIVNQGEDRSTLLDHG